MLYLNSIKKISISHKQENLTLTSVVFELVLKNLVYVVLIYLTLTSVVFELCS